MPGDTTPKPDTPSPAGDAVEQLTRLLDDADLVPYICLHKGERCKCALEAYVRAYRFTRSKLRIQEAALSSANAELARLRAELVKLQAIGPLCEDPVTRASIKSITSAALATNTTQGGREETKGPPDNGDK